MAESLSARTGLDWDPADVAMTNGGFAALAVAFRAILEPGDEVVFLSPPWFFYELLILAAGGTPVRVPLQPPVFDLDMAAIARGDHAADAGGPAQLAAQPERPRLPARRTCERSPRSSTRRRPGTVAPIHLVSDEPYNRIVFDGREFHSPAEVYPNTITTYSYGKTLLAPGMRIGYLTVPPTMPDREALRQRVLVVPARRRVPVPERAAPARDRRPRDAVDRRVGARAAARPPRRRAARPGLRDDHARGHVLRHGPQPDRG